MTGREVRDNVTKTLKFIHILKGRTEEGLLLSTDAGMAFDKVAWDFMLSVCTHIVLNQTCLHGSRHYIKIPQPD